MMTNQIDDNTIVWISSRGILPTGGASYDVSSLCDKFESIEITGLSGGGRRPAGEASPNYSPTLTTFIRNKRDKLEKGKQFDEELKKWLDSDLADNDKKKENIYFCYLLLDPNYLHKPLCFTNFVKSIFYVGKGGKKVDRPLDHLKETKLKMKKDEAHSDKTQKIKYLWEEGLGVVLLPFDLNVKEAEALSRESTIINAITLPNLTNKRNEKFYENHRVWTSDEKELLGCHCLENAFKTLKGKKIVPIRLEDLDKK
uniref:GIY-YIG domain-containing protein n=1 Tax=Rhabditophanes sp. KR3021 TaxID=114890 RepID=A0AC35TXQ3_9BILA